MAEDKAAAPPPANEPAAEKPAEGEAAPAEGQSADQKPCIDLTEFPLKIDHFENMHVLEPKDEIKGAPNYRKVNGFPVYGVGQPSRSGFESVLAKVKIGAGEKPNDIIWYNMRQEPVVYIDGTPFAPRAPNRLHENLNLPQSLSELEVLQRHYTDVVQKRLAASGEAGSLEIHKDACYDENPMERKDIAEAIKAKEVKNLYEQIDALKGEKFPSLKCVRVPIEEEMAPPEESFDVLVESLKDQTASTQCIFSCQMGRGRTTLGMIVACLIKEIKMATELRKMGEQSLLPQKTVDDLIETKFNSQLPAKPDDNDSLVKGEFDVIKDLMKSDPVFVEGKRKIDRVIDICGPTPKGSGLQNLRECIVETKWKYDVAPEEKQVVWKQMIIGYMQRYFYLICFGTYALEVGPGGFQSTFKEWMNKRSHLRVMIEEGKDKLEWYRQVDPAKLNTLKDLINSPNYKENLGTLIKTIYEFAFMTYADLPRGEIKNNSMRKLAAKTLMEILPPDLGAEVQKKLDEQAATPDFVTLIGLVSYHGKEGAASV